MYFKPSRNSHTQSKTFLNPNCFLRPAPARPYKNRLQGLQMNWTALAPLVGVLWASIPSLRRCKHIKSYHYALFISVVPCVIAPTEALVLFHCGREAGTAWTRAAAGAGSAMARDIWNRAQTSVWVLFHYFGCSGDWKQSVPRNVHENQTATSFAPSPFPLRVRHTGIGMTDMT